MAAVDAAEGRIAAAQESLAEVVHAWPATVFSIAWPDALPPEATTADIVDSALARWRSGQPIPELNSDQGLWLTAMGGDGADPDAISESVHSLTLSDALITSVECADVGTLLDEADAGEQRSYLYWWLRSRRGDLWEVRRTPTR